MSIKTIKELAEYIWTLEDEFNLLDLSISGVKPWQAYRHEITYEIGKQLGVYEKGVTRNLTKTEKYKSFFSMLKNSFFRNPLLGLHKVDVLVFPHARSQKIDGVDVDIYTHYLKKDLIKEGISFFEFEEHCNGKHLRKKTSKIKYLDYMSIYRNLFFRFVNIDISRETIATILAVEEKLREKGVSLNLLSIFTERIKKFILVKKIYYRIFKKTRPKKIYLVVSYGRAELIDAAKELGIDVIELQHGTFSEYHLGYSFKRNNIRYFPTTFLVWNEFWKNIIEFPIDSRKIKIYPFQFLENKKRMIKEKKVRGKVLIVGQGGVTNSMLKKIVNNEEFFRDKKLYLKLHPNEYDVYNKYTMLPIIQKKFNITIFKQVDLYKELASSEFVAGIYSTVLYEAIEFNCKPLLFNLSGIEHMDKYKEIYKPIIL